MSVLQSAIRTAATGELACALHADGEWQWWPRIAKTELRILASFSEFRSKRMIGGRIDGGWAPGWICSPASTVRRDLLCHCVGFDNANVFPRPGLLGKALDVNE